MSVFGASSLKILGNVFAEQTGWRYVGGGLVVHQLMWRSVNSFCNRESSCQSAVIESSGTGGVSEQQFIWSRE